MTRITKDYDERHAEFLATAQQLFFSQGYEKTSVQMIINAMDVAKGTFYHYFASKAELLDALIRNMFAETLAELKPIVDAADLSAPEKLEQVFRQLSQWQSNNREFLIESTRALYQDSNILLRLKMEQASGAMLIPLLSSILKQGAQSAEFTLLYPEETAEFIIKMTNVINDTAVPLVLAERCTPAELAGLEQKIMACHCAIARLIGINEEQLHIFDLAELPNWINVAKED